MRMYPSSIMVFTAALLLSACTTTVRSPGQMATNMINRQSITTTTAETYPAKNPQTVSEFNNKKSPPAAYRVIGEAKVSKYNLLGMPRQEETVDTMMKGLAASIGGDGLIDIHHNPDGMQAKVIAYQKIML